jgi:hypothetical protein
MGRAAFDVFPARPIYYYLLPERDPSQHAAFFTRVALLAVNITCPDAEGIEPQSYTFVLPYPMAHDHVCQRGSFGLCAVRTFPSPCPLPGFGMSYRAVGRTSSCALARSKSSWSTLNSSAHRMSPAPFLTLRYRLPLFPIQLHYYLGQ